MKRSPSRVWYWVAALLVVAGVAYGAHGCGAAWNAFEEMPRVGVPGQGVVALDAGSYTLYAESGDSGERSTVWCSLAQKDGTAATLGDPSVRETYQVGARKGASLFDAEVPAAGDYLLDCDVDHGMVIAVGRRVVVHLAWTVLGALAAVATGAVLGIVVFVRRRRRIEAIPAANVVVR